MPYSGRQRNMSFPLTLLFLGTGTSTGVPLIGCACDVCRSKDPLNERLRSSILIRTERTALLVDSCPDLRRQALRHGLASIDAVLYTHGHLDHVSGFDDMRAFGWKKEERLPLYAGEGTMQILRRMYDWAFAPGNNQKGYVRPEPHVHGGEPFAVGDLRVVPVPVLHATVETYGYVFEWEGRSIGYVCDVKEIPPSSMDLLRGLDILVLDALRYKDHWTHLTVDESLALMRQLRPKRGFLTHMGHEIDYRKLADALPANIMPAYDGLSVELKPLAPLS